MRREECYIIVRKVRRSVDNLRANLKDKELLTNGVYDTGEYHHTSTLQNMHIVLINVTLNIKQRTFH